MNQLESVLMAHNSKLAKSLVSPTEIPLFGKKMIDGTYHLGAIIHGREAIFFAPGSVVASSKLCQPMTDPGFDNQTELRNIDKMKQTEFPAKAVLEHLDLPNYNAKTIAARLGDPNKGHLLRFQAVKDGQVIGGYSIIVHG